MQNKKTAKSREIKYFKLIISLLILSFVIFFGIKVFNAFKENNQALEETLPSAKKLTSEYSTLIPEKFQSRIKVKEVFQSKLRNPIALLSIDSFYHLHVYKINSTAIGSLRDVIHLKRESLDQSVGYSYAVRGHKSYFNFKYKAGKVDSATILYLSLGGDSLNTVSKNDSILAYSLLCDKLAIKYAEHAPVDILVVGKEKFINTIVVPMNILFLKRNRSIYFLLMTPIDPKASMPADLLYRIVTGG